MECPRCSAQIKDGKCEFCGYEVPKENSDYANEILESVGRIAGKVLTDVADAVEKGANAYQKEGTFARGEAFAKKEEAAKKAVEKKLKGPGLVMLCIVFIIFFVLPSVMVFTAEIGQVFQALDLDSLVDDEYTSGNTSWNTETQPEDLMGEYNVKSVDSEALQIEVWIDSSDSQQYALTGQAAEYASATESLEEYDGPAYVEAENGEVSVLYKRSPIIFILEDLGDHLYLMTDGSGLVYEAECETQLESGKAYSSFYVWLGSENLPMSLYMAEEDPPFVSALMGLTVDEMTKETMTEETSEAEHEVCFVTVQGIKYMISSNDYNKLEESGDTHGIRKDDDMGVMWYED